MRGDGYIAVPDKLNAHAYAICHWNPKGYVQRDSVSCRREHENSPMGRFVPGFDKKTGNPIARAGYIVHCKRDSDCYSRCPAHPLTGSRYVCQKTYKLYDVARTDKDGNVHLEDLASGSGTAFDPDPSTQAITGETGICVDYDSSLNQNCPDKTMAAVMDGLVGCFDKPVSAFLCGLELNVKNNDLSTASLEGNFFYDPPRVLVAAGPDLDGDGLSTPALTCSDPVTCQQLCLYLEKTSAHGAGAPPACAICDLPCSSNILTTVVSLIDAIFADMMAVVRLLVGCFKDSGLAGCACQMALVLQPEWRRVSTSKNAVSYTHLTLPTICSV